LNFSIKIYEFIFYGDEKSTDNVIPILGINSCQFTGM